MNNPEPSVILTEELETHHKPLSWQRNYRTSCDSCKQMKIKCQRNEGERCARCISRKLPCTTTPVERKKRKVTKKREEYFDDMEERIKRMESAIVASTLQVTVEPDKEEEKTSSEKIENQAGFSNHLSSLIVDPEGSPSFIGWASGFSLFSPQGLRWISERAGDEDDLTQLFGKISIRDFGSWGRGSSDVDLWYPTPRSQHTPIPSKDQALKYVQLFFLTFNNDFPIINRKTFDAYFERQYSRAPPASTAWYALFNIVLSLGSIRMDLEGDTNIRYGRLIDYTSAAREPGVEYFRNASACYHDLVFKESNLMAMQAIVLMMYITTSSSNPQPAYILASAAGNLANTLGLHRSYEGTGVSPEEIEQRRNVFWVFYLMEKSICHNLGRPSVINDDDIAVALPPRKSRSIQAPSREKVYDIFQDRVTLAIIGSRIYSELYTASSQTKSEAARVSVLGKLDTHLQRWRDTVPIEIRPEHPINCSDEQYVSVIKMHFVYLDAVILLHRLSGHQESFKSARSADAKSQCQSPQLNPMVHASQLLCLAAARRSIKLLDTFSSNSLQNQYIMWTALYYPLSASLVLFSNILSNPHDQNAASDLHLTGLINSFIAHSVQPGTPFATTPTLTLFKELHRIVAQLVSKSAPRSASYLKRQPEIDDPTESDVLSVNPLDNDTTFDYDLNPQPTTFSDSNDFAATDPEIAKGRSDLSLAHNSEQIVEGDVQSTSSVKLSQTPTDDSPLEFAPFMPPDASQYDYDSTLYDSFLSPRHFEWDMADMWIPNFAPDSSMEADTMDSNRVPDNM